MSVRRGSGGPEARSPPSAAGGEDAYQANILRSELLPHQRESLQCDSHVSERNCETN